MKNIAMEVLRHQYQKKQRKNLILKQPNQDQQKVNHHLDQQNN